MRYRLVTVGPLRRGFLRSGCAHYVERLRPLAPVEVHEVRGGKGADAAAVRESEADALLAAADGHVVALDERGRSWRTGDLAEHVARLELGGTSRVSLLIGGADGLADRVRSAADDVWRLSAMTMAHELARLVLLEQLYRIETVRAGHPYHRD